MLAINNRDAGPTRLSPFFLTYSYYTEPIQVKDIDQPSLVNSQQGSGEAFVRKL